MKKEKVCSACGRSFEFRKKWEKNWDEVKFCSDRCRSANKGSGKKETQEIQLRILDLLKIRPQDKTICPSEVLTAEEKQNKEKMEKVRQAARLMAHDGQIEITQGGKAVDPDDFRGPIRLRLKQRL